MKKKLSILLCALLLAMTSAAFAEGFELDGTVEAGRILSVTAPYSGLIGDFDVKAGDLAEAGTALFPIAAQKVYAETNGVVTGLFAQPGDRAAGVAERFGALCYVERDVLFEAACTTAGSDSDVEDKIVHPGETVYVKSTQENKRRGVGRVTSVSGDSYTVEITFIDDLKLNDSIKVYRDSDHDTDSCIGSGRTRRIDPVAITAEGYVLGCHVTDGQVVSRGDLLFTIVPDQLKDMQGGEAAAVMPESGVLLSVSAQSGAQAAQDAVLATYCPAGEMEVVCMADEEDLAAVEVGARVKVTLEAYENETIDGEVTAISSAANENGEFAVTVSLREAKKARIGMSATVAF